MNVELIPDEFTITEADNMLLQNIIKQLVDTNEYLGQSLDTCEKTYKSLYNLSESITKADETINKSIHDLTAATIKGKTSYIPNTLFTWKTQH